MSAGDGIVLALPLLAVVVGLIAVIVKVEQLEKRIAQLEDRGPATGPNDEEA